MFLQNHYHCQNKIVKQLLQQLQIENKKLTSLKKCRELYHITKQKTLKGDITPDHTEAKTEITKMCQIGALSR